ncbi:MAG: glycoside hydrolase family 5 protein [Treponema sp.]|nr:glycoside hydrolase family 5 protein [Candidatus Treponema equi]
MNLGTGWNLGNTLDAHNADSFENQPADTETSWGQPTTTKEMIEGLAKSGIKTIRLPVSWTPHINADYVINSEWMNRVKTIVDWCMECDMYVILNIHHDNYINQNMVYAFQGYYPNNFAKEKSIKYVTEVWKQVSEVFADDEYRSVIFETLNEPRLRGHEHEWNYEGTCEKCQEAMEVIKVLNQAAVDTIRAASGVNKDRLIMVPAYVASPYAALSKEFAFPADIQGNQGKIALSVHMYTPYNFAMNCGEGGYTDFSMQTKKDLDDHFDMLKKNFINKGYPVIIGEYGATNKNNKKERLIWFDYYIKESAKRGIVSVLWDNGIENNEENPAESFGFFNRKTNQWYDNDIKDTIIKASNIQQ